MKYRIVNRKRFITFCILSILLIAFILLPILNDATAKDSKIEYIKFTVSTGDTLWDIAKEYGSSNMDIREIIYIICEKNNLNSSSIYPGQEILIPCK